MNIDDVRLSADLSKITIDDKKIDSYLTDMQDILKFIEQMNAIDTDNITPMAHPFDLSQRLREDKAVAQIDRQILQSNAKNIENGLFLVPKVIE
ncbi:MAG: Asp-tRNA(Asn)/Glu-tRNA(Gln) amidotransferase GatCAB subunit C [Gammaproteobacteria bacterium]|nr:MAG: Asp-tRNA(Asn)/Glu-tRNA(Gln) amidotransferase GatCAB subunit C [Gammaproteobacteria bacterium]